MSTLAYYSPKIIVALVSLFLKVRKGPSLSTPTLSQTMFKNAEPQIIAARGGIARLQSQTNTTILIIVQTRICKRLRCSAMTVTVPCLIIATFYSELPVRQFRQDPRDLHQLLAVKAVVHSLFISQNIWSCPHPSNKTLEPNDRHHTELSLTLHPPSLIRAPVLTGPPPKPARKIFRCSRVVGS